MSADYSTALHATCIGDGYACVALPSIRRSNSETKALTAEKRLLASQDDGNEESGQTLQQHVRTYRGPCFKRLDEATQDVRYNQRILAPLRTWGCRKKCVRTSKEFSAGVDSDPHATNAILRPVLTENCNQAQLRVCSRDNASQVQDGSIKVFGSEIVGACR